MSTEIEAEMEAIQSTTETMLLNASQADSSFYEDQEIPEPITVNVEVHAEMNATPIDQTGHINSCSKSTMKSLVATAKQKLEYEEIFAIEDGVNWRTVSKDLDRYRIRIKNEEKSTSHHLSSSFSLPWKPGKVTMDRRSRVSWIERPPSDTRKSTASGVHKSIADELITGKNRTRKRKSSDHQKAAVSGETSDGPDENQENICKKPALETTYTRIRNPFKVNNQNECKPKMESHQSEFDFDAIVSGKRYFNGREVDAESNLIGKSYYGKSYASNFRYVSAYPSLSDSDDSQSA